jgi:hypothetical protein
VSRFGKLSAQLYRRLLVSFGGFFSCVEVSQSMALARALNFCSPAISHFGNAFEAARVVHLRPTIMQVLRRSCLAQVLPTIIAVIFIPMIDFKRRPFTRHPQPDDTVCKIVTPLDDNADVPLHSWGTRLRAFGNAVGRRILVNKLPCPPIIIKKVPDVLSREIGVGVLGPSDHSAFLQPLVRAFNRLAFWRFAHVPFVRFAVPSSPSEFVVITFDYSRPTINAAYSATMNYWSRLVYISTQIFFDREPTMVHAGTLAQMPLLVN